MNPAAAAALLDEIDYPSSDGEPLGENDWHSTCLADLVAGLREVFAARPDVYVASNLFLYYVQGDPRKNRAPDVMVIFGVPKRRRHTFKTWEEGARPSVIIELASPQTVDEDLGPKRETYAALGVPEYYLFDPSGTCLDPPLLGLELFEGSYRPMAVEPDGGLTSRSLGLRLVPEGEILRLIDLATARPILTGEEKAEALLNQSAQAAAARAQADTQQRRADEIQQRLQAAQDAADAARRESESLAEELARLRAARDRPGGEEN